MYRSPPGTICRSQRHGRFVKSTSLDFVGFSEITGIQQGRFDLQRVRVRVHVHFLHELVPGFLVFFLHFICRDFFLFLYFLRYPFDLFCTKYVQMN